MTQSEEETVSINVMDALSDSIDSYVALAKDHIDEYWREWRAMNLRLANLEHENGFLRGSIVPRLYFQSGKYRIEWFRYEPNRYGKRLKTWGNKIKRRDKRPYTIDQFERKAKEWELDLIMTTENQLHPLRIYIDAVHEAKVKIQRQLRAVENRKNIGDDYDH